MANETLVVDLDAMDETTIAEEVNVNPEADPFSGPPPIREGTRRLKITVIKDSWKKDKTKPKSGKEEDSKEYLACRLQLRNIEEGEPDFNFCAFDQANTLVFDGKSYMAGILKAAGATDDELRSANNYIKLAKLFKQKVELAEPILKVRGRWIAQGKATNQTTGKAEYYTVLSGMKNFPPILDAEGKPTNAHRHIVTDPKSKDEVVAQFVPQEYLPD